MAPTIWFFATHNDLARIFSALEEKFPLEYVTCERLENHVAHRYKHITEIPNIGVTYVDSHQNGEIYMISDADIPVVELEKENIVYGGTYVMMTPENNPQTVQFWPAGLYGDNFIIWGHINTVHDKSLEAKKLLQKIRRAFSKNCTRIGGVYFGQEALSLRGKRRFICINCREPIGYDFQFPQGESEKS